MRWTKSKLTVSDRVIKRKFLWFPTTINYETRWLEWARIEYEWVYVDDFGRKVYSGIFYNTSRLTWRKVRFVDEKEKDKK